LRYNIPFSFVHDKSSTRLAYLLQQAWWLCSAAAKERKHATPQQQPRRSQTAKT
jgi:hypothetical protein